jgi:hypothetical protein
MRRTHRLLSLLAWLASGAFAQPDLTVRVYDYMGVSDNTLSNAESVARRIFQRAGIEAEWVRCATEREAERWYPGCRKPKGAWDLILHVVPRAMEGGLVGPKAMGFAAPVGEGETASHAWVFFHRVRQTAAQSQRSSRNVSQDTLLGHVMAHEIGHLLLGPNQHAQRGVMRPYWRAEDFREMETGCLVFESEQAKSLRAKLRQREGRLKE